jgi:aspartyl protease family protein
MGKGEIMRRGRRLFIGAAVSTGIVAAGATASFAASTEIKANALGHFFTTAYIEHAPIQVLVDTGASLVALSYDDAEEAGLRPWTLTFDMPISTANGQTEAARVTLGRVEIDNILVRDVEAVVLPKGAFDGTLLGMSFLNKLSGFKVEDGRLQLSDR